MAAAGPRPGRARRRAARRAAPGPRRRGRGGSSTPSGELEPVRGGTGDVGGAAQGAAGDGGVGGSAERGELLVERREGCDGERRGPDAEPVEDGAAERVEVVTRLDEQPAAPADRGGATWLGGELRREAVRLERGPDDRVHVADHADPGGLGLARDHRGAERERRDEEGALDDRGGADRERRRWPRAPVPPMARRRRTGRSSARAGRAAAAIDSARTV